MPPIMQSIMQSAWSSLPELKLSRADRVATPVRWTRNRHTFKELGCIDNELLQHRSVGDHRALRTGPCTDLALSWPGGKVIIAHLRWHLRCAAKYPDLPIHPEPRKQQAYIGIAGELAALMAVVIGIKNKVALVIKTPQQQVSRSRVSGCISRCKHHCVRLWDTFGLGLLKPQPQEHNRVCVGSFLIQLAYVVVRASIQIHT